MKRFLYVSVVSAVLMTVTACTLDYPPQNTLVDELVYKQEKTAQAALMGAYTRLNVAVSGAPNDQNNYANIGYGYILADIGTDNIKVQTTSSDYLAAEQADYSTDQHDGYILQIYRNSYNAIDYANNIIFGVNQWGEYDEPVKRRHIAEARFIRAYCYMQLLQYYGDGALTGRQNGLGLVMRTEPYSGYDPAQIDSRQTVEAAYALITDDLLNAAQALPLALPAASERYRATRSTVWALLARVCLYRGSYTNDQADMRLSAQYADSVLSSGYVFPTLYNEHRTNIFPNNVVVNSVYPDPQNYSDEVIFFQPSRQSSVGYASGVTGYFRKVSFCVNPDFAASYPKGDLRGMVEGSDDSMIGVGDTSSNAKDITSLKFDNSSGFGDVIYMRLSEVKLTRAEALARSENTISAEALKHLNDVRCRPYLPDNRPDDYRAVDFASVDAFIDTLLVERNRELAFEGQYRWDLIRTGRDLKTKGLPDNRKILPIPEYEVRISSGKILQNTGFSD